MSNNLAVLTHGRKHGSEQPHKADDLESPHRGERFPEHLLGDRYAASLSELRRLCFRPVPHAEIAARRRLVCVMPALVAIDLEPVAVRRRRVAATTVVATTITDAIALPAKRSTDRAPIRRRLAKVA